MMKISTRSIASLRIAILVCLLQILAGFSEVYAQCWNSGWSSGAAQYHGALTSCSNTTIRSGNLASTCYNQWDCVYGTNYTFTASGGFVGGGTVWTYFEYTGSAWQARLNGTGGTANITSTINSPSGSGWGLIVFYYNSSCPPTWSAGSATLQYRVNSQASPTINNSSTITVCAGSAASYSVSGNCNYPLTRTAGPASGAAAALGNTTVTHATQYARGDGGYFWWNPGATNQQIALAACEATYGAGNCSAGGCGSFTYYYRTAAGSCNCVKAVGELEFIYDNTGHTTIGQDYGGGPATVPTISASATSGAGPFVRRKGWAACSQPSTWQLVQPNLRSYGGTTASFTITGLPAASAGTVTAGTTPQCIGGTTTYTVSGVVLGGGSGAWSSSNGSIATVNSSTGLVTAVSAGTCNIIYTVTGGCGGTKTSSASYTVNPDRTVGVASSAPTVCINTSMTSVTHATTGVTGIGSSVGLPAGVTASYASNTITISGTPTASGTFYYTITPTGCGSATATGTITVNPNNTIAAGVNRTTCINTAITSISLATTGATGATFSGLPSGVTGSWSANVATISGTPTASGTFNYTVTMTGGCTGGTNTATGTITVNPYNTIAAGVNRTTCINTAITSISLATTGATGATFSGLPSGVTGSWSANVATISGTPTASGTFNYTVTMTGGCTGGTNTATGTITVNPYNTIAAGVNRTTCINTAITSISLATTGATGATFSGLPSGVTGSWSANVATISGTPTASGTFNYTVTMTGGCTGGTNTATGTITVNPYNTIAAGVNRTTCINTAITSISLATTGATGATFSGLPSGVTGSWSANVATISGTPTASGTFNYTVTMTGGCTGGTNTATGTITVNPYNTIAAGVNRTTCINTAITSISLATTGATGATFSGLPSGVTGSWSANVATISGTPTASGTFNYTVTMTGGCTGGTNTATGTITVNPYNTIAAGVNRTTCINTAITSISLATTGATGATFSGLPSGVTGSWSANVATISGTPTASGTFNYTVTMTGGCTGGTNTATGTITVNPYNTIAAGVNRTTCINTAITSISLATTGATGATFSGLPSGVTGSWSANVATISGTPTASGTFNYTVTMTGGCTGGTNTATGTITVNPYNTIAAGVNRTTCINTAITSISLATTGATGATFSGLPSGVTGSWSANVATISGTPTASGTFNYTVTMTGGCTGGTNTATGTITVNPYNTIAAGVNRTTCINTAITSISLATTGATGATFSGLPSGVTGSWSANVATISGTPTASGTFNYTVTMTGGCTGGTNTATGTITVNAAPVAYIIPRGGDSVGCTNDEFVLETSVSGGGGGSPSYQWYEYDFGTSSYTLISGATSDTFKTAPLTNTSGSLNKIYRYKVEYNVSGSGCTTGIDEVDITILPTPSLTSTMEACAGTASGGEWDYVYTTATLGSGPYSVADSTGGSVVVFASPGDVLKIFRVPMGTGSHNFAVTDANGCMAVSTLSANASLPNTLPNTGSAGNASGQCILKGFNEWVHIRKEFSASEVIASVKDNGVDLGTVTVESYREATSPTVPNSGAVCVGTPVAAMRRHFVVKSGSYSDPSVKFQDLGGNPTDVSLRLYFSQDDFDTLVANTAANNVSGNRCTEDDDITSMNALYLTKYSDYALLGNEDGDYLNNSTNSAYYRVFNVGNITNPMLIKQNGFDTIFGTTGSTFHYAELNVSEFSELWLHGSNNGTPLPVEMLFIEAKNMNNEYIKINWATATELNNMRFDVERSTDGEHFTKIGEVQGNGTSTERHDYSYSDKDVTAGIRYYYRLKQIDFDEKYEYSPVVGEMLRGEDLFRVSEFVPNPAADQAKLFITTGTEQEITIEVNNYMGEVVKQGATYLNKGSNTINFDFGDLAAGTYTTRVVAGANTYVRRVIITR